MPESPRKDTVRFTTKGRIVIPARLREVFQIEKGTAATVEKTAEGILLRPRTAWSIKQARGIAKKNRPSATEFSTRVAHHKAEERALEDAKYARFTQPRSR